MRMPRYAITAVCLSLLFAVTAGAVTEDEYKDEIRTLQQRNAQLENSLEEVTAAIQQADVTITMLKKQIMNMTSETEAQALEVTETRKAMKVVKKQLTALLTQQADVDVKALEQQLAAAVQRTQKLDDQLKRAKLEIEEQDKLLARLQRRQDESDSQQLQQQISALQAELQQQRDQLKATVGMLQNRETEINIAKATIQQLQTQVRDASNDTHVKELEAALADANAKLITAARENNSLETQLHEARQNDGQLQSKSAEIARLEGELRKAAEYINTRAADITDLEEDKSGLQTRQLGLEKTIIELETRVGEMQTANTELESRLTAVTAQNNDMERHLDAVRTTKVEVEMQLLETAKSKSGIENRLTKSLEERSLRIQQLETQIQDVQARLEDTQAQLFEAGQINLERSAALQKLEAEMQYQSSVPDAAKERIKELNLKLQDIRSQFDIQETMKREYPQLQQEVAACQTTMNELIQEQDRCQAAQKNLQEQVFSLDQTRERLEITLLEKLGELDAAGTRNLELKQDVVDEAGLRKTDAQTYQDTIVRNRELEAQYAENMQQLKLKEQVLQQVLTDKALMEQQLETSDGSFSSLRAQLEQSQRRYAEIQEEVMTLRQIQAQRVEAQHDTTSAQAMLQERIQQEQTRRRQLEAELLAAQKTAQTLQQHVRNSQSSPAPATIQPIPATPYTAASQATALQALFPQEIIQSLPGGRVTILNVSPN